MKNNADTLCQQLLKEKRIRLIKTNFQNIPGKNNSYALNEAEDMIGLNLSHQALKETAFLKDLKGLQYLNLSQNMISDISMLADLKNLAKLNLNQNRITDISCLGELKKLNWVNLTHNKISALPADILEWGMDIKWESEHSIGIILAGNPLEEPLRQAIDGGRKALTEYFDNNTPKVIKEEAPFEIPKKEVSGGGNRSQDERIKILILAANPKLTPQLRLDQEIREIDEGLERAKLRDRFEWKAKLAVRYKDLRRALLDNEPQIVHFIGHGDKDGLKLEDETGNARSIPVEVLSKLFGLCSKHLESVILNACYSESQANAISEHIDNVIGMWDKIQYKSAIAFAVGFYDALAAGRSIDDSFEFGCNAISEACPDGIQHLIPVLKKKRLK